MLHLSKQTLVNSLIARRGYSSLLEVSTAHSGFVFDALRAPHKERARCTDDLWGDEADDAPSHIAAPASEVWRRLARENRKYDLIFLDGVHTRRQSSEDLREGLERLTPRGCLVVHDCNPPSEAYTGDVPGQGLWCGEVYRAFCELRAERGHELAACVVDTDYGCGIVERTPGDAGAAEQLRPPVDFEDFAARRTELLNLISPAEFFSRYVGFSPAALWRLLRSEVW